MKNPYYQVKRILKKGRLRLRRWQAIRQWGWSAVKSAPAVFGNAMPKAGSHLLIQILYGLTEIGPFINPGFPPVNRFEDNSHLKEEEIIQEIRTMRSGEIRYGYIDYREPFHHLLTGSDIATVFIYRDPRDLLVSHVFYATDIHEGHGMHDYYAEELGSMEERLNVAIEGCEIPGLELPNVLDRYQIHFPWIEGDEVLSLRFEDLILDRERTLGRIVDYISGYGVEFGVSRSHAIRVLGQAIRPQRSGTFRKGEPGNWREHFTEENKARFKAVAGGLLRRLGYEEDDSDW